MRPLIVDTNLLVLFVVGLTDRLHISRHKRLQAYTEADFDLLINFLGNYSNVIVTPNTLTETSNFLRYVNEPIRSQIFAVFRAMLASLEECYIQSRIAADRDEFIKLGLADSVALDASAQGNTLLTADLDLYLSALHKGYDAVNFNHLREASGTV